MIRFALYGIFGWCAEVMWTAMINVGAALRSQRRIDVRLIGHTYLWMFPIYGGGGLLFEVVHGTVGTWAWPVRGGLYMLGCFAVEYGSGWLVRRVTGTVPWDYSQARWGVHDLIRLDYAPVWFAFGLILEVIERLIRAAEPALRAAL